MVELTNSGQAGALARHPLDGGLPLRIDDKCLDPIDRLRDGLRHLQQRWENGLLLNNADLIEKYLSSRFSVALYLEPLTSGERGKSLSGRELRGHTEKSAVIVIDSVDAADGLRNHDGQQEPVLVADIKFVKGPQKAPSSLVRAYFIDDERADAGNGRLYSSISALTFAPPSANGAGFKSVGAKGRYKFLPRFPHRERQARILPSKQLGDHVIKGGFQTMDCVTDDERDASRQRLQGDDANMLAALSIVLHPEFAEIRFEKGVPFGMEVIDVLIGPYML